MAREITQGSFAYADEIMAKLQEQLERTMSVVNQGRDELRLNIKDKNISE